LNDGYHERIGVDVLMSFGRRKDGTYYPKSDGSGRIIIPEAKEGTDQTRINEQIRLAKDQEIVDKIDDWIENTSEDFENTVKRKSDGLQPQGIAKLAGITKGQKYNLEIMLENNDWNTMIKNGHKDNVKREFENIKKSVTDSALYQLKQEYGHVDDINQRTAWNPSGPKNPFNEIFAEIKDEELGKYENRDIDYAQAKRIIDNSLNETFAKAYKNLPEIR